VANSGTLRQTFFLLIRLHFTTFTIGLLSASDSERAFYDRLSSFTTLFHLADRLQGSGEWRSISTSDNDDSVGTGSGDTYMAGLRIQVSIACFHYQKGLHVRLPDQSSGRYNRSAWRPTRVYSTEFRFLLLVITVYSGR